MNKAPTIPTTAKDAYYYAHNVIEGRWPEGEATIATNPESAYGYARDVIKDRWPEAEATIATDPQWHAWYQQFLTFL